MNSTPTRSLQNTYAGIKTLTVFKQPVKVIATTAKEGDGNSNGGDVANHLELAFIKDQSSPAGGTVVLNRAYGTVE